LYLLPRHSRRRILFGVFLACVALLSYPRFATGWPSSIQDGGSAPLRSLAASVVVNLLPAPAGFQDSLLSSSCQATTTSPVVPPRKLTCSSFLICLTCHLPDLLTVPTDKTARAIHPGRINRVVSRCRLQPGT